MDFDFGLRDVPFRRHSSFRYEFNHPSLSPFSTCLYTYTPPSSPGEFRSENSLVSPHDQSLIVAGNPRRTSLGD